MYLWAWNLGEACDTHVSIYYDAYIWCEYTLHLFIAFSSVTTIDSLTTLVSEFGELNRLQLNTIASLNIT